MELLKKIIDNWFIQNPYHIDFIAITNVFATYFLIFCTFALSLILSIAKYKESRRKLWLALPIGVFLLLVFFYVLFYDGFDMLWWLGFSGVLTISSLWSAIGKENKIKGLLIYSPILLISLINIIWMIKEYVRLVTKFGGHYLSYAKAKSSFGWARISNLYEENLFLLCVNLIIIIVWGIVMLSTAIIKRIKKKKTLSPTK